VVLEHVAGRARVGGQALRRRDLEFDPGREQAAEQARPPRAAVAGRDAAARPATRGLGAAWGRHPVRRRHAVRRILERQAWLFRQVVLAGLARHRVDYRVAAARAWRRKSETYQRPSIRSMATTVSISRPAKR